MIDRSYLPFKSARTYKDRKMAKWMGFFLSDHQTALLQSHMKLEIDESMSLEERLTWLGRLYAGQYTANFEVRVQHKGQPVTTHNITGKVYDLSLTGVTIKHPDDSFTTLTIDTINRIRTEEMANDGI